MAGKRKGNDNNRYVVPNSDRGSWDVVKDHGRASFHSTRKTDAQNRAREITKNQGGGELQIRDERGRIIDSDTIAPGRESNLRDTKKAGPLDVREHRLPRVDEH
jgi:hypothetical protein